MLMNMSALLHGFRKTLPRFLGELMATERITQATIDKLRINASADTLPTTITCGVVSQK